MNTTKIELLNGENYETWRIHVEAILIKGDNWSYVNGKKTKPAPDATNANRAKEIEDWEASDLKAKSEIILCIGPSELKEIKSCTTSKDVWDKLEGIYRSKGPARKATYLKQLTLQKMIEGDDVRKHLKDFFDAKDKLNDMGVVINEELLAIMLLYSLPQSYDNFRCAMESRDTLPSSESLKTKIMEENDSRKNGNGGDKDNNLGMVARTHQKKMRTDWNKKKEQKNGNTEPFMYKCHTCGRIGHKARDCLQYRFNKKKNENKVGLYAGEEENDEDEDESESDDEEAKVISLNEKPKDEDGEKWCLDSGCSSHMCKEKEKFTKMEDYKNGKLKLASNMSTDIEAKGKVEVNTEDLSLELNKTLYVPDLRTNLMSVSKITDKGYSVIFNQNEGTVIDGRITYEGRILFKAPREKDLYYFQGENPTANAVESPENKNQLELWHRRMGHLNFIELTGKPDKKKKNSTEADIGTPPTQELNDVPEPSEDQFEDAETQTSDGNESNIEEMETKRKPGRPKTIKTGKRGRPKKVYQMTSSKQPSNNEDHEEENIQWFEASQNLPEEAQIEETSYNVEIPVKEAMNSPEAPEWTEAFGKEITSILKHGTFVLVKRPKNKNIVGCRVIFTNKYKADGSLERRKARVIARGFSQQYGVDYTQTFAPVARLSSIRLLSALAAHYEMEVYQIDITTAYLNGDIDEEIYMEIPPFFKEALQYLAEFNENSEIREKANKMLQDLEEGKDVCLMKKALYGLKQSGRMWNIRLNEELLALGLKRSNLDPCLYYKQGGAGIEVILTVYVDDILIAATSKEKGEDIKLRLAKNLEIKDLGKANYCLGIQFKTEKGRISLNQRKYTEDTLKKYNMINCKTISTPLDQNLKLMPAEDKIEVPYRELIGSLMYLAVGTRPDIAHATNYLSQFNETYGTEHWNQAKKVLRYLKKTIDYQITYEKNKKPLVGYADAAYGRCVHDGRSYTGYVFMLSGGPISWESRKQKTTALSATEAEYMAMSEGTREAIYLKRLIIELGADGALSQVILYGDNMGAIKLVENPVYHSRSKHIDIKYHFIREQVANGELKILHLGTSEMPADILTKGLGKVKQEKFSRLLGLKAQEL